MGDGAPPAPAQPAAFYQRPLFAFSGWAAAAVFGALQFPAVINSFRSEAPKLARDAADEIYVSKAFTGVWSSESGAVDEASSPEGLDPSVEGEPVKLALRTYDGAAQGEIISEGLRQYHIFSRLEVEGQLRDGRIEGQVWDIVDGHRITLATFVVEKTKRHAADLQFRVTSQRAPYFPKLSYLYRQSAPIGDEEGEINARYFEIMRKVAAR